MKDEAASVEKLLYLQNHDIWVTRRCGYLSLVGSYEGYVISLDLINLMNYSFNELLLKVPIKLVLVDESYFGNRKTKVKFIWDILSISRN